MKFKPGWSARAWCSEKNEHKTMDTDLANEIERLANAKLEQWLAEAPTIYGHEDTNNRVWEWSGFKPSSLATKVHKAKLVCIEPIGESKEKE